MLEIGFRWAVHIHYFNTGHSNSSVKSILKSVPSFKRHWQTFFSMDINSVLQTYNYAIAGAFYNIKSSISYYLFFLAIQSLYWFICLWYSSQPSLKESELPLHPPPFSIAQLKPASCPPHCKDYWVQYILQHFLKSSLQNLNLSNYCSRE